MCLVSLKSLNIFYVLISKLELDVNNETKICYTTKRSNLWIKPLYRLLMQSEQSGQFVESDTYPLMLYTYDDSGVP